MKIKFYGTRGSIASPSLKGKIDTSYFGGNTTCLEVIANDEEIIIDGGTGLRSLGNDLLKRYNGKPINAKIFFSHVHWDHIQGWPFFVPAFRPGNKFKLYGEKKVNRNLEDTLKSQQQYPNFPVLLKDMGAAIEFIDLDEGTRIDNGIEVGYITLKHPDGVFSYRIKENGNTLVYASDTEHDGYRFNEKFGTIDKKLIEWARNADALIYDGQYIPEEYDPQAFGLKGLSKKGWGHSTPQKGIEIALEAGVKTLILTHHDPSHGDDFIHKMEQDAKDYLNQITKGKNNLEIIFAYEGLELKL